MAAAAAPEKPIVARQQCLGSFKTSPEQQYDDEKISLIKVIKIRILTS